MSVEFTAKYATFVETIPDAFTFVMEHLDRVGPEPSITISPVWGKVMGFDVAVSGMVEQ